MIWLLVAEHLALAIVAALGITVVRYMRAIVHELQRQNARLVNQVCHLAGRDWEPPPADVAHLPPPLPDLDLVDPGESAY